MRRGCYSDSPPSPPSCRPPTTKLKIVNSISVVSVIPLLFPSIGYILIGRYPVSSWHTEGSCLQARAMGRGRNRPTLHVSRHFAGYAIQPNMVQTSHVGGGDLVHSIRHGLITNSKIRQQSCPPSSCFWVLDSHWRPCRDLG